MSKPSGWVRPSMISCSVCTVVFSLLAVSSSPSFWITAFTFCCISDFPMSFGLPPIKDKNLRNSKITDLWYSSVKTQEQWTSHFPSTYPVNSSLIRHKHGNVEYVCILAPPGIGYKTRSKILKCKLFPTDDLSPSKTKSDYDCKMPLCIKVP